MQARPHRRAYAHASPHVVRSRDIGVKHVAWRFLHAVALSTAHAVAASKAACTTVCILVRTCHRQGNRLTRNPNKRLVNQSHACLQMPSHSIYLARLPHSPLQWRPAVDPTSPPSSPTAAGVQATQEACVESRDGGLKGCRSSWVHN